MIRANILAEVCKPVKKATTAVVLTHNIDFLFVQSILLSRLHSIGHPKLTIFADASCSTSSYNQQFELLSGLGQRYRVVPLDLGNGRRFHPKAIFLAGPDGASLAIGSGNLTHGGWSANKEIWAIYAFPGEGGPAVAAFREYLRIILAFVPDSDAIRDSVMAAFTPENWAKDLPEPGQLLATPDPRSLLSRILEFAGTGIETIDVLTPYFDPNADALRAIGELSGSPVRALLQLSKAGISQAAADGLGANVSLIGYEPEKVKDRPIPFVHAKLYALRKADSVTIATGSANCSKAALLADDSWGNAELMAVREIAHAELDDILSPLTFLHEAPELPASPPNDEWKFEAIALRILSAKWDDGWLDVRYKASESVVRLRLLEKNGKSHEPAERNELGRAIFAMDHHADWVRLVGILSDGSEVSSTLHWIDDEAALEISGPEQQLRERLRYASNRDFLNNDEYLKILELFNLHLREKISRRTLRTERKSPEKISSPYTAAHVFSDTFGRNFAGTSYDEINPSAKLNTWALLRSFFQLDQERGADPNRPPPPPGISEGDDTLEVQNNKDQRRRESPASASEEHQKAREQVLKLLKKIETTVSDESFVSSRPADRLADDIGFLALLLPKLLHDQYISFEEYQSFTGRVWAVLFFGRDGRSGRIPQYIAKCPEDDRSCLVETIKSTRLSAAVTFWCLGRWGDDLQSEEFRRAAALLAARCPWLTQASSEAEMIAEIARISEYAAPEAQGQLLNAWVSWVRSGVAISEFEKRLSQMSSEDIRSACTSVSFAAGTLVWQGEELYRTKTAGSRDRRDKIGLYLLGQPDVEKKFRSEYICPVDDLLAADLGLLPNVVVCLKSLLGTRTSNP